LNHGVSKLLRGLPDIPSFKKPQALLPKPSRSRKMHLKPVAGINVSAQKL
jgi:hypothetical protein